MAEEFKGITRSINGSNGLIQDLIEAWIAIGESLKPTDASPSKSTELIAFLRNRLSLADGSRAWNVAPSNSEIKNFADWKIFAQILAQCAFELSSETSVSLSSLNRTNSLSSSNTEREHRIFLIAWNLNFLDLINETLSATAFPEVSRQSMNLSQKEEQDVQMNILVARKRDLEIRNSSGAG